MDFTKIMNKFDERQLNIMMQKINNFKYGKTHFNHLIEDLEALLNILEEKDENWFAEFREYWFDLEQVYAFALYKESNTLDLEDQRIISEAVENLEHLIKKKLP